MRRVYINYCVYPLVLEWGKGNSDGKNKGDII